MKWKSLLLYKNIFLRICWWKNWHLMHSCRRYKETSNILFVKKKTTTLLVIFDRKTSRCTETNQIYLTKGPQGHLHCNTSNIDVSAKTEKFATKCLKSWRESETMQMSAVIVPLTELVCRGKERSNMCVFTEVYFDDYTHVGAFFSASSKNFITSNFSSELDDKPCSRELTKKADIERKNW